jgi:hypothetical protein
VALVGFHVSPRLNFVAFFLFVSHNVQMGPYYGHLLIMHVDFEKSPDCSLFFRSDVSSLSMAVITRKVGNLSSSCTRYLVIHEYVEIHKRRNLAHPQNKQTNPLPFSLFEWQHILSPTDPFIR